MRGRTVILSLFFLSTFPSMYVGLAIFIPQASASATELVAQSQAQLQYSNLPSTFRGAPTPRRDGTYVSRVSFDAEYDQFPSDSSASAAVNNRLYFGTVPHEKLVLRNEVVREANGLPRHFLESIRPFHPFYVDY